MEESGEMYEVDEIFQSDVMLPDQYFGRLKSKQVSGELRLWFASFQAALVDLKGGPIICNQTGRYRTERRKEEARTWMESPSGALGSFIWVCDVLGLDPLAVREAVAKTGVFLLPRAEPRQRQVILRGKYRRFRKLERPLDGGETA